MKCKNCGHRNQPNAMKCTACNAPTQGSMILEQGAAQHKSDILCKNCGTSNDPNHIKCKSCNAPLAGTNIFAQVETSIPTSELSADQDGCPDCGYPNVKGSSRCAACKHPLKNGAVENKAPAAVKTPAVKKAPVVASGDQAIDPAMTINPWALDKVAEEGFSLTPIVQGELVEKQMKTFDESQVILNRTNLDPKNTTITNKKQATITQTEEGWTIENNSQLGTTFIQVSSQKKLEDGDVILMGDVLYKFTAK